MQYYDHGGISIVLLLFCSIVHQFRHYSLRALLLLPTNYSRSYISDLSGPDANVLF